MKILTPALRSSNTPNPMRFITCFTALILTAACASIHAQSPVAPGAKLEKMSDGFKFTPAAHSPAAATCD